VLRSSFVVLALSFTACSSSDQQHKPDSSPSPVATCTSPDRAPTFADLESGILTICRECHSASVSGDARHGAPPGMDFDTYDQLASAGETAAYLVRYRIMPFPNGEGPTEEQRQQLYEWVACGMPR
jgi:uncharacterized membrane protein